jgi:hypothetical protein
MRAGVRARLALGDDYFLEYDSCAGGRLSPVSRQLSNTDRASVLEWGLRSIRVVLREVADTIDAQSTPTISDNDTTWLI